MNMKMFWLSVLAAVVAAPGLLVTLHDGLDAGGWNPAQAEEIKMPNDNGKPSVKAKARASASATASAKADRTGNRCEASSQASAEAVTGRDRQVDRDEDHAVREGDNCRAEASSAATARAGEKGAD